jgi:hypothetical protein
LPLSARDPFQPPDAVQETALLEAHARLDDAPAATAAGDGVSVTVGAGITVTVTVAAELTPPGPAQVNEYVAFWVNEPVSCVPLTASAPLQSPAAAHAVA